VPLAGDIDYSQVVKLDLGTVAPSLAGPKRPQDRIELGHVKRNLHRAVQQAVGRQRLQPAGREAGPAGDRPPTASTLRNGDVLIAAITSCTNTSNPGVLLAAGLLAKKAVEAGLKVKPHIKTSLAPGSRIVTEYLEKAGLLPYLEKLGFNVAAYGCTTCIGNAGDLTPEINEAITKNDLVCAAVLSGNRNFEARIHPNLKANFLASPPLVVAYAIAGTVTARPDDRAVGKGQGRRRLPGRHLADQRRDPRADEVRDEPKAFRANYAKVKSKPGKLWEKDRGRQGQVYTWPKSTYIAEPPFFDDFTMQPPALAPPASRGARIMGLFGDSITTDHISPAGSFKEHSRPASTCSPTASEGRLQQLRRAPRQPRGDDARHLRQRAHQEPDAAAAGRRQPRGRRRHAVPSARRCPSTTRP
jgi:aconitate hydratase